MLSCGLGHPGCGWQISGPERGRGRLGSHIQGTADPRLYLGGSECKPRLATPDSCLRVDTVRSVRMGVPTGMAEPSPTLQRGKLKLRGEKGPAEGLPGREPW